MMAAAVAWLGGTIFVTSLAVTAYWYFVQLGQLLPFAGYTPVAIDAVLVTIFAAHHSLFARDAVKRALAVIPATLIRSFYVWIASALLIGVVLVWRPVGGEVWAVTGIASAVLALCQALGVLVIARSVAGLDPLELAGIRQATGTLRRAEALQISGPYRIVRHPLYLGWVIALFGSAHMTGDRLTFAVLTTTYLVLAVPWEERALLLSFGEDYARYKARVRWRIVPYLY